MLTDLAPSLYSPPSTKSSLCPENIVAMDTKVAPNSYVDVHCHLLPGLDDGAKDWAQTVAMARIAVDETIQTVIATPHQLGSYSQNHGQQIRQLAREAQDVLNHENVALRVLPGADVRIEDCMVPELVTGKILTLADQGKHVLLELPHELYFSLTPVLKELEANQFVGILSHPERNHGLLHDRKPIRSLVDQGCLMQITAGSLLGNFGKASQSLAEWMIQQRLVHFVATDAHGDKSRRPHMRRAFECIIQLSDEQNAWNLCFRNGHKISLGQDIPQGIHVPMDNLSSSWFGWKWNRRQKNIAA